VWLAGGIGLAAIGVGTYFGVRAISKRSSSDEHCHGSLCDPEGVDLNNQAKSSANVSNVAFGVGIVGLGVATWLLLSGHSQPKPAATSRSVRVLPVPGPRGAAILVQTAW
jgi:serine/threonine-protein kinase